MPRVMVAKKEMMTDGTRRTMMKWAPAWVCLSLLNAALAGDWQPVPGNVMTRWAKEVSADNALPEYPRPQMVREQWQTLNGLWDYSVTNLAAAQPVEFDGEILVPFCVESALSGVKQPLSEEQRLWYRRTFTAPDLADGQRLLLNFGAVDWESKVLVNGKQVGEHKGGYDAFTLDITDAVNAGGTNELVVSVFDASDGAQARGKQRIGRPGFPRGIWYTPCSGIWQTVWLETVPKTYIESLKIVPDLDRGTVAVTVNAKGGGKVTLTALAGEKVVATGGGEAGEPVVLKIPEARLWAPGDPFLYDLRVTSGEDVVTSYFGMRKIAIVKDDKGVARIRFNGKEVFQVGLLDQGYWPDGIYTAPTDEALRYDIEATLKLGITVARKHVKIEPDRWYYWCDKLGLIVWQDMPSPGPRPSSLGSGAGRNGPNREMVDGKASSPEAAAQFEGELKAMIEGRWNHPSIVMWIVFNEGWGQYDTPRLTKWVKDLDPTRLVNNASGGHDIPAGDILDAHQYAGPRVLNSTDGRASVCGEFGGFALPVPGHTWAERTWGYRRVANADELTGRYVNLLKRSYELRESEGLAAVIYTQTTDVETECNGMITYDREIVKPDPQRIADASQGRFSPDP